MYRLSHEKLSHGKYCNVSWKVEFDRYNNNLIYFSCIVIIVFADLLLLIFILRHLKNPVRLILHFTLLLREWISRRTRRGEFVANCTARALNKFRVVGLCTLTRQEISAGMYGCVGVHALLENVTRYFGQMLFWSRHPRELRSQARDALQ